MRIGISGTFWPALTTGSGQHIRGLLPALVAAGGADYTLYVPRFALPASLTTMDSPVSTRIVATPFDQRNTNLAKLWYEQIALPRACHRDNIELVHIPYLGAPLLHSLPVVVTVHDLIPLLLPEYRGGIAVRTYMRLAAWAAQRAQFVIAVSQSAANDAQRVLHIPEQRISVVYNAVSEQHRPILPSHYALVAQKMGLPEQYLLYLGGFDRRKNVPELLSAFRVMCQQVPAITLVIAGRRPSQDTAFFPDPQRLVNELGLAERVRVLGEVAEEDKPALYSGALAFVFPSSYEGFGLPALESLACGTPAILCTGSSLEEVGGAGALYVPSGDIPALGQAMLRLCTDADQRQQLAQAGLVQAQRFSWSDSAKRTLAVYRSVLDDAKVRS
ncbi:MAG: glycosyltransferase family 4 protein [Anaerolineae bacterium]